MYIIDTISKIKEVLNEELEIEGLLPVMVDNRRKLSREVLEVIAEQSYKAATERAAVIAEDHDCLDYAPNCSGCGLNIAQKISFFCY